MRGDALVDVRLVNDLGDQLRALADGGRVWGRQFGAQDGIFPAVDVHKSGTRREELLFDKDETNRIFLLRNFLGGMASEDAITFLLTRMGRTRNNREFFASMAE